MISESGGLSKVGNGPTFLKTFSVNSPKHGGHSRFLSGYSSNGTSIEMNWYMSQCGSDTVSVKEHSYRPEGISQSPGRPRLNS